MIHADLLVRSFNDPRSVPTDAYSHYANVLYDVGSDATTRTRIESVPEETTLEGQSFMDSSRSIPSMHPPHSPELQSTSTAWCGPANTSSFRSCQSFCVAHIHFSTDQASSDFIDIFEAEIHFEISSASSRVAIHLWRIRSLINLTPDSIVSINITITIIDDFLNNHQLHHRQLRHLHQRRLQPPLLLISPPKGAQPPTIGHSSCSCAARMSTSLLKRCFSCRVNWVTSWMVRCFHVIDCSLCLRKGIGCRQLLAAD